MTDTQLDRIEAELQLKLPADYRAVSREFPFRRIGEERVYWFYDDPEEVIQNTRFPMDAGNYDRANWRDTYLVIGHGAAGDEHLIDTALADSPVYLLSHEDHSLAEEWPSLRDFVADWNVETERAEQQAAERARQRSRESQQTRRLVWILLAFFLLSIVVLILLIRSPHQTRHQTHPRHSGVNTTGKETQWTTHASSALNGGDWKDGDRAAQAATRAWANMETVFVCPSRA